MNTAARFIANRQMLIVSTAAAVAINLLVTSSILALRHPLRIGHDQAQYMLIGKALLEGARLYIDIDDNNPPAICFINLLPAFMSNLLNEPAPLVFSFFTLFLTAYCFGISLYIYWQARPVVINPGAVAFMLCVPIWILLDVGRPEAWMYEFGQREQLCMLGFMPLFILSWLRVDNRSGPKPWISALIGMIAGFGLAIKPVFFVLLISLGLERSKSFKSLVLRPELFGLAASLLLYAGGIALLPKESRDLYFGTVVPIYFLGYTFFERSLICLLNYYGNAAEYVFWSSLLAAGFAVYLGRFNSLIPPACVLMFCGYVIDLQQGKGWPYHLLPLWISTAALIGLEAVTLFPLILERVGSFNFKAPKVQLRFSMEAKSRRFATSQLLLFLLYSLVLAALQRRLNRLSDFVQSVERWFSRLSLRPPIVRAPAALGISRARRRKTGRATHRTAHFLVCSMKRQARLTKINFDHLMAHLRQFPQRRGNLVVFILVVTPTLWWTNAILEEDYRIGYGELRFVLSKIGYGGLCSKYDLPVFAEEILKYTELDDPIAVICRSTEPGSAVMLQLRRKPALAHLDTGRLCCLLHVEALYPKEWNERYQVYRQTYCNELIVDILSKKPKLVFIQNGQTAELLENVEFSKRAMKNYEKMGEYYDLTGYKLKGLKPKDIEKYFVPPMNVMEHL